MNGKHLFTLWKASRSILASVLVVYKLSQGGEAISSKFVHDHQNPMNEVCLGITDLEP